MFFKLLSFLFCFLLFTVSGQAQDWPIFRGDVELRGRTTLKNPATKTPTTFSAFQVGGGSVDPIVADVDGDSQMDLVFLRQGRVVAATEKGVVLVDNFYGATDLVAVTNLDDSTSNNSSEIVVINSFKRLLIVINADGAIRWQHQFPEFVELAPFYCKTADLLPDRPGKEIVVFPDHTKTELDARGYFFSSTGQLYSSPVVANLFGGQLNFPQIAVADLDADSLLEVVVVGRPRLMVFSASGQLRSQFEFREGDIEGRHYGLLSLADVDGDKTLEAVVIGDEIPVLPNNFKSQAITVLKLTPTISRIWGTTFPGQTIRAPLSAVGDLDGDGQNEITINLFADGLPQIRVYKGSGEGGQPLVLSSIAGYYVWHIEDLDNDTGLELMASKEFSDNPSLSLNSTLQILKNVRLATGNFDLVEVAEPMIGSYILSISNLSRKGFESLGISSSSRFDATVLRGRPTRFLIYKKNIEIENGVDLQELQLFQGSSRLRLKKSLNTLRPGLIKAVTGSPNNESFYVSKEIDGRLTGELALYVRQQKQLSLSETPLFNTRASSSEPRVADLDRDGANEILIRAPSSEILVLGYNEESEQLSSLGSFQGNMAIIETLVEKDAEKRPQIITTRNDSGRLRITVYQIKGSSKTRFRFKELWGRTFSEIAAGTDVEITTGRFAGLDNRRDLYVSTPRGDCFVLSGSNGDTLWMRQGVYNFGNHPSVRDFNLDGKDDIYIVSDNLYRIVDGGQGADLVGPINVSSFNANFGSTPILSGTNEVLMVGSSSVVRILDRGKQFWNFSKVISGKLASRQTSKLLMGLADLGNGGNFDRLGGNYGDNDSFYIYDYSSGLLTARTSLQPITEIVSCDIDNDGKDDFIFGTADGQVVAVSAETGKTIWMIETGFFTGNPVIVSLGTSKKAALVVASGDGNLRVYTIN
ncbi:MAG: PQQ-binding-like beta-propeller repeat protein [Blastocatellia bacterium]|nr:PQQ-binding-like beta-propeller repeat protein [Blastocatellia bacterium]